MILHQYIEQRLALLNGIIPLDEKAENTKFHRLNELQQLQAAVDVDDRALGEGAARGVTMNGTELIAEKVRTNREHKGYTEEHDDGHNRGEMVEAAVCYLDYVSGVERPDWPFEAASWKPSDDPIRNLVHAGALIAAEIDRLQRVWVRTEE